MKIKLLFVAMLLSLTTFAQSFLQDETKAYAMPLLTKTSKGEPLLSWTEKDEQGQTAFCMSTSKDGKNFSDKKTIASSGVGNSRLMRARVLSKKDGSLVAVFMYSPSALPSPPPTVANEHATHTMPQPAEVGRDGQNGRGIGGKGGQGGKGGGGRGQLAYSTSKDGGNTWTAPMPVDTDPTPNLMRGFFDATVLANDEIAVAYLKDVKNSTKHEERDLRIAITKGGVFQAEKLIDAVVCDCCNISLLVDNKGVLSVYYRDNNNDIRDMAKMTSTDNGQTFSKSDIIYKDNWQINGCPHNGAVSTTFGNTNLVSWYSAAETEKGIRLVSQEGKKISLISDMTAKNQAIAADGKKAVFLWEQTNPASNNVQIAYQIIDKNTSATQWIDQKNTGNATALVVGNELVIAYEQRQEGKKTSVKINKISL